LVICRVALLLFVGGLTLQAQGQTPTGQASGAENATTHAASASQPGNQKSAPSDHAAQGTAAPAATAEDPLQRFPNFSALMVGTVLPRDEREGHIYRSGNLLRMEGMENRGYFITDLTTFDTYGLSSMGCAFMKQPYLRSFPFVLSGHGHKMEREAAGKETVEGHVCQIEEVTYSGGLPQPWKLKFWEAEDLHGFPIKIEARAGSNGLPATILYKNIVLAPQDPTLFIYPKDCAELPEPAQKDPASSLPNSAVEPPPQH
jgi:hypothetical protein